MRRDQWQALLSQVVVRRVLMLVWIVSLLAVIIGSLMPSSMLDKIDPAQEFLNDKQQHFLAYLGLALLPPLRWNGARTGWLLAAAMLLLGIALEFAQRLTPDRQFEGADMIADGLGVLVGMLFSGLFLFAIRDRSQARPR